MMRRPFLAAAMFVAVLAGAAHAQAPAGRAPAREVGPPLAPPPRPEGYDSKNPLSPGDLARKNERGYVTGLPLANFDPNTGVGGGARAYYYYNGDREDPLFAYTPYLHRVFLQFFASSGGLQFHWLDYDAPAVAGTAFRLRSQLIFMRNTAQRYFGVGSDSLNPLTFTGAGRTFDDFIEYDEALRALRDDGTTLARYNQFDIIRPLGVVSLERTYLNGLLRPLVGFGVSYTEINDYTGKQVDADGPDGEVQATMGDTLLREQCEADLIEGCDGGFDNILRFGLSFDTRDFEPDPNNGFFADVALDLATPLIGSEYSYARFLLAARYYRSLLPGITDLVGAVRGTFQATSQGAPFYSLSTLSYTEDSRTGLGGLRTLRGYQQDRFVGHLLTLLNFELRWTFYRFTAARQKFGLMLVGFVDLGRVYDELQDLDLANWKRGQGGALRISWNLATIVTVEYGFSEEDSGIYINFNHMF